MTTTNTIKAAFQSWENGCTQTSSFYSGDKVQQFVESHYESGTFATLHTFDNIEEGRMVYDEMQKQSN